MSKFDVATRFFHACEGLTGAVGCAEYVAEGAGFEAQCEPLVEITSVLDYCDWLAAVGKGPLQGCRYILHSSAYDDQTDTALFYGTFIGKHVAEGGPVPVTHKETVSQFVYALEMDQDGKVSKMTKIWNAPWALSRLGWM